MGVIGDSPTPRVCYDKAGPNVGRMYRGSRPPSVSSTATEAAMPSMARRISDASVSVSVAPCLTGESASALQGVLANSPNAIEPNP